MRLGINFNVGDKVWLELYNLSTGAPLKKLAAKHLGLYEILERIGTSSYQLSILAAWQVHNVFHASLLSKTKEDTIPGCVPLLIPTVTNQDKELWVIDCFVNL